MERKVDHDLIVEDLDDDNDNHNNTIMMMAQINVLQAPPPAPPTSTTLTEMSVSSSSMILPPAGTVTSVVLLRDLAVHAFLAITIASPICVALFRYCLYDFFLSDQYPNTTTFETLSTVEQIRYKVAYYNFCHFITIAHLITVFLALTQHAAMRFRRYISIYFSCFIMIQFISTYVMHYMFPFTMGYLGSTINAIACAGAFVILMRAERDRNSSNNTNDVRKTIIGCGISSVMTISWALSVIAFEVFRKSDVFRWTSPFVVPMTAFLVRYWGQRSPLPASGVSKISSTASIASSVISRASQCAYSLSNPDEFQMFLILEGFYDVVGVVMRVTLHHRQLVLDKILSCVCCGGSSGNISNQNVLAATEASAAFPQPYATLRSRLISSQCVVHGCVFESISFVVLFVTRVSLMPTSDFTDVSDEYFYAGKLVSVFVGCVALQMVCYHITNVLVRKVEAVPIEELDMPIRPFKKLWASHLYYVSGILLSATCFSGVIIEMWFPSQSHVFT